MEYGVFVNLFERQTEFVSVPCNVYSDTWKKILAGFTSSVAGLSLPTLYLMTLTMKKIFFLKV